MVDPVMLTSPGLVSSTAMKLGIEVRDFPCEGLPGDDGTAAVWMLRHIDTNGKRRTFASLLHGTMASGMPSALGLQKCQPGRQVICLSGDGGFAMLLGELLIDEPVDDFAFDAWRQFRRHIGIARENVVDLMDRDFLGVHFGGNLRCRLLVVFSTPGERRDAGRKQAKKWISQLPSDYAAAFSDFLRRRAMKPSKPRPAISMA